MATPVMKSISRSGAELAPAAIAPPLSLRPFAEDAAGAGYFASDHHHRYVAAAIFRELAKGRWFVLLCGEHAADAELVERFLNDEGRERYRATLLRCQAETDFGAIVRAYNRRLGLRQEAASDGLWTLLSHLMAEVRKGVRRILVLDNADALEPTCFDELLRFTRLDEPHVMPVVLLGDPGFADRLASPAYGFLTSAIAGRVGFDRLEPEEVGAFLRYQLNATGADAADLFPPEVVSVIAATAGGSAAAVNRLARDVLEQARDEEERAAAALPPPPIADPVEEAFPATEEPEAAEEPEELSAPPAPLRLSARPLPSPRLPRVGRLPFLPRLGRLPSVPRLSLPPLPRLSLPPLPRLGLPPLPRLRRVPRLPRLGRLPVPFALGVYAVAASLSGLGLLYLLAPRASHEPTVASAPVAEPPTTPIVAAAQNPAVAPTAPSAPPSDMAAQAAAVEPSA
ncbi:MAG TPA: AAA family ATPase, partial [Stellaceae bacterium]|nr:AAA family ATPase [Stellaceae bacterium]